MLSVEYGTVKLKRKHVCGEHEWIQNSYRLAGNLSNNRSGLARAYVEGRS